MINKKQKGFGLFDSMIALALFGGVVFFVSEYQKDGRKDLYAMAYYSEINRDTLAFSKYINAPKLDDNTVKTYHYRSLVNVFRNSPSNISTLKNSSACIFDFSNILNNYGLNSTCNGLPITEDPFIKNYPTTGDVNNSYGKGYDTLVYQTIGLKHFNDLLPRYCIYWDKNSRSYDFYLFYQTNKSLSNTELLRYKTAALIFGSSSGITDTSGLLKSSAGWVMPSACGKPTVGTPGVYLNLLPSFMGLKEDNIKLLTNSDDNSMLSFRGNTNTLKTDLYISSSGNDTFLQTGKTTDGDQELNVGNRKFNDYVMNTVSPSLSNLLMLYPTSTRGSVPNITIQTSAPKLKFAGVSLVSNSSDYQKFMPNESVPYANISNPYQLYSPCNSTNELGRIVKAGNEFAVCMRHPYCWEFSATSKNISHTCYMPMIDKKNDITIQNNSGYTSFRCDDIAYNPQAATSPYIASVPTFSAESVNYEYLNIIKDGGLLFQNNISYAFQGVQERVENQCSDYFLGQPGKCGCAMTQVPNSPSITIVGTDGTNGLYSNQFNCSSGIPGLSGVYGSWNLNSSTNQGTSNLDGRAFMIKDPLAGNYVWSYVSNRYFYMMMYHLDGSKEVFRDMTNYGYQSPWAGNEFLSGSINSKSACGYVNIKNMIGANNSFDADAYRASYKMLYAGYIGWDLGWVADNSRSCNKTSGDYAPARPTDGKGVVIPFYATGSSGAGKKMDQLLKINGITDPGNNNWKPLNLTAAEKSKFMHIKINYLKTNAPVGNTEHTMTGNDSNINSLDNYAERFTYASNTGVPNCAQQCSIVGNKLGWSSDIYFHEYSNIRGYQNTKACVCYQNLGWNGQAFYTNSGTSRMILIRPTISNSKITVKKVSCSSNPLYFNTTTSPDPSLSDKSQYRTMSISSITGNWYGEFTLGANPTPSTGKCLSATLNQNYNTPCNGVRTASLTCNQSSGGTTVSAGYYKTTTGANTCAATYNTGQKDSKGNYIWANNTPATSTLQIGCTSASLPYQISAGYGMGITGQPSGQCNRWQP